MDEARLKEEGLKLRSNAQYLRERVEKISNNMKEDDPDIFSPIDSAIALLSYAWCGKAQLSKEEMEQAYDEIQHILKAN